MKGISLKSFVLPAFLTLLLVSVPHTGDAAITLPWNNVLEDISDQLRETARILSILGMIVCAIGLAAGNAGDGMKKVLIVILAVCIAAYAATFVNSMWSQIK